MYCKHVLDTVILELKERSVLDMTGFFFRTSNETNSFINIVVYPTTANNSGLLLKFETTLLIALLAYYCTNTPFYLPIDAFVIYKYHSVDHL